MQNTSAPFFMGVETKAQKWRFDTFRVKEPETLAWIEHFKPSQVFFDIGANIGIYSLYAGMLREDGIIPGLEVYAFEPVEANYSELVRNKKKNEFSTWFHTWVCAIGSYSGRCSLEIPDLEVGASGAQVVEGGDMHIWAIDDLITKKYVKQPDHVKIDIDGQELHVLQGMENTLPGVKSLLIEVSSETKWGALDIMKRHGFTDDNRFNRHWPHSRTRREQEGVDAENIIFTRL